MAARGKAAPAVRDVVDEVKDQTPEQPSEVPTPEEQAELLLAREAELDERSDALDEREQAIGEREEAFEKSNGVDADDLGVAFGIWPRDGYGYVALEAPLPLVRIVSTLHVSEQASVAAQTVGRLEQTLAEIGKIRTRPVMHPDEEYPSLAVLSGEQST